MGIFIQKGCNMFFAIIVLSTFVRRGACQCSDSKIVEITADYSPGSLFFRPYSYSLQGEECEMRFIPADSTKSVLIQLKINRMICGVTELIYKFSGTPGEHMLCTNDTETFDMIVASPGETITVLTNTRQTDYDYSSWLEAYLLASDDKSGSGCDIPVMLTPQLSPQYVTSQNFPLFYNVNKTCSWRIQVNDTDFDIQIRVLFVDVRSGDPNCGRDFLQITNVEAPANKFRLCDRGSFLKTALRVSNQGVDLTFYDLRRPLHGFLIEYQLVNKTCTNPKADIAFLLDSSGSISTLNFRLMLSFVSLLISKYDLGDPSLQTSVVSFSTDATVHFDLNDYTSTYDALSFISEIVPKQQNTYTDRGIQLVREQVFNSSNGDRKENPNILVIFTDGVSTEPNRTLNEVNKIKENGVKVIAIGIQGFDEKEINLLASNGRYSLKIEKFSDLEKLQNVLQELICLATEDSIKLTTETTTMLSPTSVEKGEHTSTFSLPSTTLTTQENYKTTIKTSEISTQISTVSEIDKHTTVQVHEVTSYHDSSTASSSTLFEVSITSTENPTVMSSSDSTKSLNETSSSASDHYVHTTDASTNEVSSETSTQSISIPFSNTETTTSTQELTTTIQDFPFSTETSTYNIADSTIIEDLTTYGKSESTVSVTKSYETTPMLQDSTVDFTTEISTLQTINPTLSYSSSIKDLQTLTGEPSSSFVSSTTISSSSSEISTLNEENSSDDFSSVVTEMTSGISKSNDHNTQTSDTATNLKVSTHESTTPPKITFDSTTGFVTDTTGLSTSTKLFYTTVSQQEELTTNQTSNYDQTYTTVISEGTTVTYSSYPTTEVQKWSRGTSAQVLTSTQRDLTTTEEKVSTVNVHTTESSNNLQQTTSLQSDSLTTATTTGSLSSKGVDPSVGTTASISLSTQTDKYETKPFTAETSKISAATRKDTTTSDTSLTKGTKGAHSSKTDQSSTMTKIASSTSTHAKIVPTTSSLGTEKSTNLISKSSVPTQVSTQVSAILTKSAVDTLPTTNSHSKTDGVTQTRNISGSFTTENVAVRAVPGEEGGGLSLVAIWGITVTGITLVLGISSCCGCCYLIGGYRRKKRKRKRKQKYEKPNWQRFFDDHSSYFTIDFRNGHVPTRMDSKLSNSFNSKRNRGTYLNDMFMYEDLNV